MKNTFKFLGIIAITAIIGFSMTACNNGSTGGGGKTSGNTNTGGNNTNQPVNGKLTWTVVNDNFYTSSIAYGGGKFVAVGSFKNIAYSSDGITWTKVDTDNLFRFSPNIHAVTYGNGKFVAGGNSNIMAVSADGIKWTTINDYRGDDGNHIFAIAFGNGIFVAGCGYTAG